MDNIQPATKKPDENMGPLQHNFLLRFVKKKAKAESKEGDRIKAGGESKNRGSRPVTEQAKKM
jgi:hypothetical protein